MNDLKIQSVHSFLEAKTQSAVLQCVILTVLPPLHYKPREATSHASK